MNVSRAFAAFPQEAAVIGSILGGYTDLEIDLMHCARAPWDFDTVFKAMFRARGESQRLDIADAFGRQAYHELGLGTEFEMGLAAVRQCLKFRNQYAHGTFWDDHSGTLAFTNLEELAKIGDPVDGLRESRVRHISLAHLQAQFAYFKHASDCLIWVLHEGNKRAGRAAFPNLKKPEQLPVPPLFE